MMSGGDGSAAPVNIDDLVSEFFLGSPFDNVPEWGSHAPASKMNSLQPLDILGSLDFSTLTTTVYVSEGSGSSKDSSGPVGSVGSENSVRALHIEYVECGEMESLVNCVRQAGFVPGHTSVCFSFDNALNICNAPTFLPSDHSMTIRFKINIPMRIRQVYVCAVDIGDGDSITLITPRFETHMLRFAREKRCYTCDLDIVDAETRSVSVYLGVYEDLVGGDLETMLRLTSSVSRNVLRDTIDTCDLSLEQKICAKTCATIVGGTRLRLLVKDMLTAMDAGRQVLNNWALTLYNTTRAI
jgi:hypothetical protein